MTPHAATSAVSPANLGINPGKRLIPTVAFYTKLRYLHSYYLVTLHSQPSLPACQRVAAAEAA